MKEVTASFETLMDQASSTVSVYYDKTLNLLSGSVWPDKSDRPTNWESVLLERHSHLIGQLVSAMNSDFIASARLKITENEGEKLRSEITEPLRNIAAAVDVL